MTYNQIIIATIAWITLMFFSYSHIQWKNIAECYGMWLKKDYWTNYNIIDAMSWLAKAAIIIPGLIFRIQIWELYWIALITSVALISANALRAAGLPPPITALICSAGLRRVF